MELQPLLKLVAAKGGSDLFLSVGAPPHIKVEGQTYPVDVPPLAPGEGRRLAYSIMSERQIAEFESKLEFNMSYQAEGIGQFRVNVFNQRGETSLVARLVRQSIPSFGELRLPPVLRDLVMLKRGLVLIVGGSGTGKSTTLAAMIDYRASQISGHILTIEDPIEFSFKHQRSLVDQREVGIDTLSFEDALRNAMREAPDLIMIGEIRSRETMHQALTYAQSGHLCLSTLHASSANQAIERIMSFYPEEAIRQLSMDLALNLRGVVSQRLIPGRHGKRVLASEVLLSSPLVADYILKGRIDEIKTVMARGGEAGMVTFDQSLFQLYSDGLITLDEAMAHADSRTDLSLRIRLLQQGADIPDSGFQLSRV